MVTMILSSGCFRNGNVVFFRWLVLVEHLSISISDSSDPR